MLTTSTSRAAGLPAGMRLEGRSAVGGFALRRRPDLLLRAPIPTARVRDGIVGLDDLLDEPVTHHVLVVEIDEADAVDVLHDPECFDEAGFARLRQIDLGDVAGDYGL